MVDITSGIAEDLAVDVVLVAEGKNIDIPLRQSLHAFFFGNPGLDHGIGHFRGSRGGLRGAGGNSTDSKIDANIDRGF